MDGFWVIGLTLADRKIEGLSIIKWCCHGSQDCTIGVKKETWVKYAKSLNDIRKYQILSNLPNRSIDIQFVAVK